MNGDINKYFKICGSTALSRKSKDLMEERMAKVQKTSLENDNSKFSQESNKTRPVNRIEQPLASHRKKVLRRRRPQKLQMAHLSFHSEQSKQILLQNRPLLYLCNWMISSIIPTGFVNRSRSKSSRKASKYTGQA
jgi:hypothetical protein